jgi:hypothetical protein
MDIPQPVLNTLKRIQIDHELYAKDDKVTVHNRFGGDSCETSSFIARLIEWVYETSNEAEMGIYPMRISDFDRIRMYILKVDSKAYMTCLD